MTPDPAGTRGRDTSIEDLFSLDEYMRFVNEFYAAFDWYPGIDVETVAVEIGARSLGRYMEDTFREGFALTSPYGAPEKRRFGKVAIAVNVVSSIDCVSQHTRKRFDELLERIVQMGDAAKTLSDLV